MFDLLICVPTLLNTLSIYVRWSFDVFSIYDPRGDLAFDLGVTGAPESYLLIDNQVVASIQGEMTPKKWETIFYPLINQARNNK